MKLNWNFQRGVCVCVGGGGGVLEKIDIPPIGEVWIFPGTAELKFSQQAHLFTSMKSEYIGAVGALRGELYSLITSESTNQSTRNALFTCVVYTKNIYVYIFQK